MIESFPPPCGSMDKGLELLSSETSVAHEGEPRLNLLVEREPAHEIFFSNLVHTFQPAPAVKSLAPGELWHDVFLPTSLPWKSFQESLLWHFVVIFAGWALSQGWASRPQPHVRQTYRAAEALYYSPSQHHSSERSSVPKTKAQSPAKSQTSARAHGSRAMPVAAEQQGTPKLVTPPDLKLAEGPRTPNLGPSNPAMPSVPLSATARAQAGLKGLDSAVAPPPADLAAMGGRRSLQGPGTRVVEPPPSIQASGRGMGSLGAAGQVVAPPPQLPGQGLRAGLGMGPRALASGASGVVAPPPSIEHQGRAGIVSGPGVAVVPPPPAIQGAGIVGGIGRAGSAGGVGSQVVPPPPAVQSSGGVLGALSAFFSGGSSKVVPPPPSVQGAGAGAGSGEGSKMGSLGGGAVPPPPAMQAGGGTGRGRITSLGTGGSEIVPPPPTMSGAGGAATGRGGLGGSLSGGGSGVVAPPPSLAGIGDGSGVGSGGHGRGGSLSGNGTEVVPPPPSLQGGSGKGTGFGGGDGAGAGNRFGSLAGTGTGVVPPPPGLQGNGSRGHGGALMAGDGNVVAPPPSMGGGGGAGGSGSGGNGGGGSSGRGLGDLPGGNLGAGAPPGGTGSVSTGPLEQMEPLTDAPGTGQSPQTMGDNALAPTEEVPLRFISVPGGSSKTSFFSNFEVVIAERTVNAKKTEYIKLVYISLPYQKRLSEYDWNTTRIYKLRATADPRCDESLMQMMMPEGGAQPDAEVLAEANQLAAEVGDKNTKLHCYETTADDFQRAMSRSK